MRGFLQMNLMNMEIVFIAGKSGSEKWEEKKKKSPKEIIARTQPVHCLQQFAIRNIVCGKFIRTTGEIE